MADAAKRPCEPTTTDQSGKDVLDIELSAFEQRLGHQMFRSDERVRANMRIRFVEWVHPRVFTSRFALFAPDGLAPTISPYIGRIDSNEIRDASHLHLWDTYKP